MRQVLSRAILLIATSSVIAAASPALADGRAGDLTIQGVSLEFGAPYLSVASANNPDRCQISNTLALPTDPAQRDDYLALAATAVATGLKLDAWVSGCTSAPWGTVPVVYHVGLHR